MKKLLWLVLLCSLVLVGCKDKAPEEVIPVGEEEPAVDLTLSAEEKAQVAKCLEGTDRAICMDLCDDLIEAPAEKCVESDKNDWLMSRMDVCIQAAKLSEGPEKGEVAVALAMGYEKGGSVQDAAATVSLACESGYEPACILLDRYFTVKIRDCKIEKDLSGGAVRVDWTCQVKNTGEKDLMGTVCAHFKDKDGKLLSYSLSGYSLAAGDGMEVMSIMMEQNVTLEQVPSIVLLAHPDACEGMEDKYRAHSLPVEIPLL